ncbi:DUF11 domain-containing protein [Sulfitobacter albidus]|uniref:DUF11 domain-containing protein n=1 Tax=Sulfitobacter albidus TaxID=2829501 RepID=A0A975PNW5_9RHOB|nr:DUF11 domain-containing protein [Sulfitobacter albidus]QUJ78258.1 DUF11 domain-containing protein [Sulfitobacter albidus]
MILTLSLFATVTHATQFTRSVPGTALALPDDYPEAGGVAIVLVGVNGNAYFQFSNPAGAFRGFNFNGDPARFRGNPFTINDPIGLDCGFSTCTTYFGGAIATAYIRFSAFDGDTQVGGFDEDDISLRLNGFDVGNWSDVTTEITDNSGLNGFGQVRGFGNQTFNTGWFTTSNAALLSNILTTGQTTTQVFDRDPNDNYWDFRRGNNLANQDIVTVAPGYTIEKSADATAFATVGETITYSYVVTNIGSVPIRQLSVSDDKIGAVSCNKTVIQDTNPGGTADFATCQATYQITQEDFDAGEVTNIAKAIGVPDFGTLGELTDTLTLTGPAATPVLFVDKTSTLSAFGNAGTSVPYSFLIRNDGDVTLSNFTVSDSLIPSLVCAVPDLAPGDDFTCSGNYTVLQSDVDAFANNATDQLSNTVTVSADTPRDGRITQTDTLDLPGPATNVDLELTKTAVETTYAAEGDLINYQIVLRNAGNVTFPAAPAVTDPQAGTVSCPAGPIAPGNSVTCTASYAVMQADIDSGSFTNTASATVTVAGQSDTASDNALVNATRTPGLSLDKTLDPTSPSQFDTTGVGLTYEYLLTNTGNITIESLSVSDNRVGVTCAVTTLAPGESTTCTSATYSTGQGDVNRGFILNTATATGTEAGGGGATVTSNTDQVSVPAVQLPEIELTKTAPVVAAADYNVGEVVTYTFAVRNTGNVRIDTNIGVTEVTITDDKIGTFTCFTGALTRGQTRSCTETYELTSDDIDAGVVINTAVASAGPTDSDQVTAIIAPDFNPSISLVKSTGTASVDATTDSISYSFEVENTGDVRILSTIQINDPLLSAPAVCTQPVNFDPGDTFTCTGTRTGITQAELDAGQVLNEATASFDFTRNGVTTTVTSDADTATVPVVAAPDAVLSKTGPTTYSAFDEALTYTFRVTNPGNVTLRTATVTDPLIPTLNCTLTDIAPGTFQECTGQYRVTQANMDDETFTNLASLLAQPAQGAQQTDTATANSNLAAGAGTKIAAITKSADRTSFSTVGEQVTFTMAVENTGTQTLSNLMVTDVLDAGFSCTIPTLAPGVIDRTCSFQVTVDQADIDRGTIVNTATVDSPEISAVSAGDSVTGPTRTASFVLDKSAPAAFTGAGQTVNFEFLVRNTGNVTLTNVVVSDDFFDPAFSCTVPSLAPGVSDRSCTASYITEQGDVDRGSITNTARADATAPAGVAAPARQTDTVVVSGPAARPAVTITKAATDGAFTSATDSEAYTFVVRNTGNVTLTGLTVADTDLGFSCALADLAPGDTATRCADASPLGAVKSFDQADVDLGSYTNVATVTGQSLVGAAPVSDSDSVTVNGPAQVPALEIDKNTNFVGQISTVGETLSYTYRVTNRGNVTLTNPITVSDDRIATVNCPALPASGLAPGLFIDCSAQTTVTLQNLDDGFVENTATASVTQTVIPQTPGGPTQVTATSAPDTVRIEADQAPALSILKRVQVGSAASYDSVGDTVRFEYVVTNTGNVTTTAPITVSDDKIPGTLTCGTAPIAPGASVTCAQDYTADLTALNDGSVTNIATASTVFEGQPVVSGPDSVTINAVQRPALSVVKTFTGTDRPGFFDLGDTLSYSIVVTNTGNVSIDGPITLNDSLISFPGGFACDALTGNVLDPTQTYTCTATHRVTQNDLDLGAATNVVTATGSFDGTPVQSPADDAIYPVDALPALSLEKVALPDPSMLGMAGDIVNYSYTVRNTGNVGLVGAILIEDDRIGTRECKPAAGGATPALTTSQPGNVITCQFPYTLTQADVDNGSVTNNATARTTYAASGASPTRVVSPNADATVTLDEMPGLTVVKEMITAVGAGAQAGQDLTYRITATNSGNQTLRGVGITDPLIADLSCTVTPGGAAAPANVTLLPGAALVCTGEYTVGQDDLDRQTLLNTANASATDPQGATVSGTDGATVQLAAPVVDMTVTKRTLRDTGPDSDFVVAGQQITFAVAVENTGNITLSSAVVTDARNVLPSSCTVGPIAPGATDDTCRFTYVVTQADVDAINTAAGETFGGFTNVASVTATPNNPDLVPITETGEVFVRGPLRETDFLLSKSADAPQINVQGQIVTYTYRVVNAGNVTLTEVPQITDDKIGTFACGPLPAGGLPPEQTLSCRATYEVTQPDLDAGGVTNIATVTSSEVAPKPAHTASLTINAGGDPALSLVKTPSATSGLRAGEDVTYTYTVTNIGNFTLSDVTIVDRHQSASGIASLTFDSETLTRDVNTVGTSTDTAGPGVWSTLAPGDEITFTARYRVTVADIDQQVTLANLATVTATPPAGQTAPRAQDNSAVTVAPKAPGLSVVKTADTSNLIAPEAVGQQVPFTIVVTNTGNQTLSAPSLTDTLTDAANGALTLNAGPTFDSGDDNGNGVLDTGESWTYLARYDLTQQAIDAGGFTNAVDVRATDPQGQPVSGSDTIVPVVIDNAPTIGVVKTAVVDDGGDGTAVENDTVTYTYTVSNTGNVTVLDVQLAETGFGGTGTAPTPVRAAGGVEIGGSASLPDLPVGSGPLTYTATYALTQADIDAGNLSNQATATGVSPAGVAARDLSDDNSPATGADDATVTPLGAVPSMRVEKRADTSALSAIPQVGESITFTITVANTGNVTLTQPTLADQLTTADGGALALNDGPRQIAGDANANGRLDVGETFVYTARYDLQQAALDSEGIANTVRATSAAPNGDPVSDISDDDAGATDSSGDGNPANDPTLVPLAVNPGVALVKTATLDDGGDGRADAGDEITYVFTVSNTGSQTLFDVTLQETAFSGTGAPVVPVYQNGGSFVGNEAAVDLPAGGAPAVFTAVYALTQADIDAGGVINQASATVTDPDGVTLSDLSDPANPASDGPTALPTPRAPALQTVKRAAPALSSPVQVGDRIAYTIDVRNIGNVTLGTPTLVDTLTDAAGQPLTLTEAPIFQSGDTNTNDRLDVGETWTYTAAFTLTQPAIDAGGVSNTVTAQAVDPSGASVSDVSDDSADAPADRDPTTTALPRTPAIGLVKAASLDTGADGVAGLGDTVTYTYTVTNLGNVTLRDITVDETTFSGTGTAPVPSLQSGGADLGGGAALDLPVGTTPMVFTATYTLTQEDVDAGGLSNSALATGTDPTGTPVTDASDDETAGAGAADPTVLDLPEAPLLDVTKTADTSGLRDPAQAGDAIAFTITVANSGNVTLDTVALADTFTRRDGTPLSLTPVLTGGDNGVAGDLEVGETWTYRASHTLTQADIDAGGVRNQAVATANTPGGTAVSDTSNNGDDTDGNDSDDPTVINIGGAPVFTMNKRIAADAPAVIDTRGQSVPFEFVITNTGTVTLTAPITVSDALIDAQGLGGVSCPAPPIAPGAQIICTGSYAVQQADLDRGSFVNTATATSTQPVVPENPGDPDTVTIVTDPSAVTTPLTQNPASQLAKGLAPGSAATFAAVGDQITYRFTVTNVGNVTLPGPITVDDDRIGTGLSCVAGPLAVGEEAFCDHVWTAAQPDLDAGEVTNTATAETSFGQVAVSSPPVSYTAPAVQTKSLGFAKALVSATPDLFDVGTRLDYRFTVTNTGNVTVDGPITISDTLAADASCPALPGGTLAPGAELICSGSYVLRSGDIALGATTNVASASGTIDGAPIPSNSDDAIYPVGATPALTLSKAAVPVDVTFTTLGEIITYSYTVTNSSNAGLSEDIILTDNRLDAPFVCYDAAANGVFNVGQTVTCSAQYAVTQADLDAGFVTNEALAGTTFAPGTPDEIAVLSPPARVTVDAVPAPALTVAKQIVDPPAAASAGDTLSYRLTATNTGNQTLSAVSLVDPLIPALACTVDAQPAPANTVLAPGQALVCTGTYTVMLADVNAQELFNTATATGQSPQGVEASGSDSVPAPIAPADPALSIVKTLEPVRPAGVAAYTQAGEVLQFRLTARNAGNVTLNGIMLSDARATVPANCDIGTLDPGQENGSCLVSYTVTQADVDAVGARAGDSFAGFVNVATGTATAATPDAPQVPGRAELFVRGPEPAPAFTLDKTADVAEISRAGDAVAYTYLVTNSGNITLRAQPVVTDDRIANVTCAPIPQAGLLPGQSLTCTAPYTVTQADIDAGGVTNIASVSSPEVPLPATPGAETDSVTLPATAAPALLIAKTADATDALVAGQTITYTYRVTNAGNVTLSEVAVTDQHTSASGTVALTLSGDALDTDAAPAGDSSDATEDNAVWSSLAPGDTARFTATYLVTQGDVDAQDAIANTASVTADLPDGQGGVTATTTVEVTPAAPTPALTVLKTVDLANVSTPPQVGETLPYTITVANTGNQSLRNVTLADTLRRLDNTEVPLAQAPVRVAGDGGVADVLDVGETWTYTAQHVLTQDDVDAGGVANSAIARGLSPQNIPVSDQSDDGVPDNGADNPTITAVPAAPLLDVVKTVSTPATAVGETVVFDIALRNAGNVTLRDVGILSETLVRADGTPLALNGAPIFVGASGGSSVGDLEPGETATYRAFYTLVQGDLDAGGIRNSARAIGTPPIGSPVTDVSDNGDDTDGNATDDPTVQSIPAAPALSLLKAVSDETPATFDGVDQRIDYVFTVTNTGNVTIAGPISVTDALLSDGVSCPALPANGLAPEEALTCTGSYLTTQADVDAGRIDNTATASANGTTSPPATATILAQQTPSLSLSKTAEPVPAAEFFTGKVVRYTYVTTNTGNTTITAPVTVTDNLIPAAGITCDAFPAAGLAPGETTTCRADYTVTATDVDLGSVINIATATDGTTISPLASALIPDAGVPALSIVKSVAAGASFDAAGDTVPFSFDVTNSGTRAFAAPVTVTDTLFGAVACFTPSAADPDLRAGETVTCGGTYTVTQADLDRGSIFNEAFAQTTFGPEAAPVTSQPSSVEVRALIAPALTLAKRAAPLPVTGVGQALTYTLTATNAGNQTLRNVVIRDPMLRGFSCQRDTLAIAQTLECSGTYAVTQADIDAGSLTNNATVGAITPQGGAIGDAASLTVAMPAAAASLELIKTATPTPFGAAGSTLGYLFEVRNTGNVTLRDVVVTDAMIPDYSCTIAALAPGASDQSCAASIEVTQALLDAGEIVNTAQVRGSGPGNVTATARDTLRTPGPTRRGALEATKVVGAAASVPGAQVPFTLRLVNTGNVTLRDVTVVDVMTDATGTPITLDAPFALQPGSDANGNAALDVDEIWIYRAVRTLTQSDLNAGGLRNQVSVRAIDPTGAPVTDLSDNGIDSDGDTTGDVSVFNVATEPALDVTKTVVSTATSVGESVTFEIRALNIGNQDVRGLSVEDRMTRLDGSLVPVTVDALAVPASLAPGETAIWRIVHVLTQDDVNAGGLRNTALVSGTSAGGDTVREVSDDGIDEDGNLTDDPTEVTIPVTPALEVIKVTDEIGTLPGDLASFTITVRNAGNISLRDITLDDTMTNLAGEDSRSLPVTFTGSDGTPPSPQGILQPGETATYTVTAALTQADIDSGGVRNVAVANGVSPQGALIADISDDDGGGFDDPTVAAITALPSFEITKVSGAAEFVFPTVERRTFTITVTNTGNITQSGIQVRDDLVAFLAPATLLSDAFPVTTTASGFADGGANVAYDGVTDTDLLSGDATLAPGAVGTVEITATYAGQPGAPNTATVTSAQLSTPTEGFVPVVTLDTDGDGIPDRLESPTGDRDGDGVPDRVDYDPTGVFYCEDDGRVLTGGTISVSGNGATQTGVGTSGPITVVRDGRLGPYQFFVTQAGSYTLTLTYPDGTVASSTRLTRGTLDATGFLPSNPGVIGAGPVGETGLLGDFTAQANPFYTAFAFAPGDPVLINNNIPVTQCAGLTEVVATKTADRKTAVFGETVNFTLTFANQTELSYPGARFVDLLPAGMVYTPGSARLDGVAVEPEVQGRRLEWRGDLGANQTRVLRLAVRITRTGEFGERTNRAQVEDRFGRRLSNVAEASVRVDPEHVFDCSDVIGRVFDDRNGNGYQDGPGTLPAPIIEDSYIGNGKFGKLDRAPKREDQSEPGLPGVRLVTPDGILITTDEYGRYSVPCAALPRNIGSNFMLKLDTRTLPTGYRVTTENPRVVRLTAGKFAKLNFGARLGKVVDVDLTARAFVAGGTAPKPGLSGAVDGLIGQIAQTPSILNLTYVLDPGEAPQIARERLREMERFIRKRWRGRGTYKLEIDKTVTRTR